MKQKIFTKIRTNFYCNNMPLVARYEVPSLAACTIKCLSTTECTMFNFGKRNDSFSGVNQYYCDVNGISKVNISISSFGGIDWSTYVVE